MEFLYSEQYSIKIIALPVPVSIAAKGNRFRERLDLLGFENHSLKCFNRFRPFQSSLEHFKSVFTKVYEECSMVSWISS